MTHANAVCRLHHNRKHLMNVY